ncbi:MAG: pyridoxal phosphate-dependent aminotransferase [Phycisphaerales bacterium]|nr:pyridoxal phosphate-dependent aminotransferase [Phycisphaerales bacterium]MCB9841029.1 pyridoxal phosphate-dependent aminotransferase [Phycisphaeraceae bacterium]
MPPSLSSRVTSLQPSVTVACMNRAMALKAAGKDVLSFAAGEPDFDTPDPIKQAAIGALQAGQTKYMPTLGDPAARSAIAEKLVNENGIAGLTGNHVGISAGAKHALFGLMQCLFDQPKAGEAQRELLLPVPAWVSYAPLAELAGAKVVEIPTTPEGGFKVTPAQLKAAIGPKSRALILNSPSNPTGAMYSEAELRALAKVIAETESVAPDLAVITDEIYEKIVYAGVPHFSIGSVPEIAERVVTVNGLSKAFAMTGWRVGYSACPGEFGLRLMKGLATIQGQMTTNITSFVYPAIRVALGEGAADVERMRAAFAGRARLITERLQAIPNLEVTSPQGAFYAFPDVSQVFGMVTPNGTPIGSALDFADALLDESLMAVVPGEDFGGCGGNHIRISFACSEAQINKGMDRLAAFVDGLR